ncbi:lasso peptide biosynthesis PqqD family chaperone [Micromonospora inaquosa]|uniref:Lasso peptide biosynthesis PqqD family chaperone n=1 Tax=Micromonospora inaquosa TaxID=2203716 RepID=A0A3N9XG81_9ACTN|nr:lasso peptide biosynthesis PqqD family chaperone [Micromonospora inaquosa]RQX06383.1 lasso peptide biosynthesis PqqD family chaperone [Micromonospora inaquosa]
MSWRLRDRVSWAPTEYGGVLLDCASGEYWTLNSTAAAVLAALLAGADIAGATAHLAGEFDGDLDVVAVEVPQLVAELQGAGLVVER